MLIAQLVMTGYDGMQTTQQEAPVAVRRTVDHAKHTTNIYLAIIAFASTKYLLQPLLTNAITIFNGFHIVVY